MLCEVRRSGPEQGQAPVRWQTKPAEQQRSEHNQGGGGSCAWPGEWRCAALQQRTGGPYNPGRGRLSMRITVDPHLRPVPEMKARDRHAAGYLSFPKHKVQAFRVEQFLKDRRSPGHVLDLGCGPGPTTKMLLAAGYRVTAIDFSMESLKINAAECQGSAV